MLSTIPLSVNTLADDTSGPTPGYTTLRDAITQADSDTANQYVITFSVTGTIDLTSPLPDLNNNINLNGPGASNLTVRRLSSAALFSVFTVDTNATVSLSGMTIAGGNVSFSSGAGLGSGGGLNNSGTLTVSNSTFSDNSAYSGGGIFNGSSGTVTVNDSTFINNSAIGTGGGIDNYGTATVCGSTFTSNSAILGGGLYNSGSLTQGLRITIGYSGNLGGLYVFVLYSIAGLE